MVSHTTCIACIHVEWKEYAKLFSSNWIPEQRRRRLCTYATYWSSGDGGKMVCLDILQSWWRLFHPLSGSRRATWSTTWFSLWNRLHEHFPHCKIDVYDGTNWAWCDSQCTHFWFFPENFHRLHGNVTGRSVNIFKIDCEGCQVSLFLHSYPMWILSN